MRAPKSQSPNPHRSRPGGPNAATQTESQIAALAALDLEALRAAWLQRFRKCAPSIQSRDILLRLFGARIQEATYGALPKDTLKAILRAAQEITAEGRASLGLGSIPVAASAL
jgi:hypothetical protein